jgi:dTDP-4-dehydrorhamnose reductase
MILFGAGINVRPNFATWLIQSLREGKTVRIVDDQWGNVTLADDLANGIYQVVVQKKNGIYNMAGADFLNRYEFSLLIAEIFGLNAQLIQRIKTSELKQKSPRPLISGLILDKAKTELGLSFLTARESLLNLKAQLTGNNH